jgi:hypothetical protein
LAVIVALAVVAIGLGGSYLGARVVALLLLVLVGVVLVVVSWRSGAARGRERRDGLRFDQFAGLWRDSAGSVALAVVSPR